MIKQAAIRYNGVIFIGKRHRDIVANAPKHLDLKHGEEGFVTTQGLFLDREKAAMVALMCGQIKRPKKKLISEDLY